MWFFFTEIDEEEREIQELIERFKLLPPVKDLKRLALDRSSKYHLAGLCEVAEGRLFELRWSTYDYFLEKRYEDHLGAHRQCGVCVEAARVRLAQERA